MPGDIYKPALFITLLQGGRVRMKRKSVVAMSLVAVMTMMAVVPVLARDVSEDTNISGWNEPEVNCTADVTLTVDEGHEANIGTITAGDYSSGFHDVTITGGGTLNVESTGSPAISGNNVNIDGTTVNASSDSNVIEAHNDVNISDANVNLTGTGTNSTGINAQGNVSVENSDVTVSAQGGHGIQSMMGNISIDNSNVSASANDGAVFAEEGTITLSEGLTIETPEGGYIGTPTYGVGNGIYASTGPTGQYDPGVSNVVINKAGGDPTPAPTPDPTPAPTPDPTPAPSPAPEPEPSPTPAADDDNSSSKKPETPAATQPAAAPATVAAPTTNGTVTVTGTTASGAANASDPQFSAQVVNMISSVPAGGEFKLEVTGSGAFLNEAMIDALIARSDVSVSLNFSYLGAPYSIRIPAGYNLKALKARLAKNGGILDLAALIDIFGTDVVQPTANV